MADVTPPVGLASFAAAAISGADPIKTGITAFYYSLRTVALPFLFIFNTDLLLIDVTAWEAGYVFVVATVRSEEHTSELQSLMRISYAVFCLKKKKSKENIEYIC